MCIPDEIDSVLFTVERSLWSADQYVGKSEIFLTYYNDFRQSFEIQFHTGH